MIKKILIVTIAIIFTTTCFSQKGKLDGQTFKIRVIEKNLVGKEHILKDEISFKDEKISTKFSTDNGFPDAKYTTESKDAMVTTLHNFKAESTNKKGDKLSWEGSVNADEIQGEASRERKGKIKTIYSFKGTLK